MGAFGFVGAYTLIVLAAPVFLKKRGELKARTLRLCVAAMVLMLIPIVGQRLSRAGRRRSMYFPYVFGAYLWFGILRVMGMQHQKPERVDEIGTKSRNSTPQPLT